MRPPDAPLGWVLSRDHAPGTNVKGAPSGGTWRFLLPTPYPSTALVVGAGSRHLVSALRDAGSEVQTVEADASAVRSAAAAQRPAVIVAIGVRSIADHVFEAAAAASGATAYVERRSVASTEDAMHLAPTLGEIQVAVPTRHGEAWDELVAAHEDPTSLRIGHLLQLRDRLAARRRRTTDGRSSAVPGGGPRQGGSSPILVRAARGVVAAAALTERTARRHTRLAGRSARIIGESPADTSGPPLYIREAAPFDMATAGWWFAGTGEYRSQKLVFRIPRLDPATAGPIVKVGRDRWSSERLEHGSRGLSVLEGFRAGRHAPSLLFGSWHADSYIAGESHENGRAFEAVSDGTAGCRWASAALAALTELATETRRTNVDVAPSLLALADAFSRGYPTAAEESDAIRRSASAVVAGSAGGIPSVIQHGDPGSWNMIARDDGSVALLDWENFEQTGVPLFDIVLFLHGYALFHDRQRGFDGHRIVMGRHFGGRTDLSDFIAKALRDATMSVGMDPSLIPHIVPLALAYQALKEVPRLHPGATTGGVWLAELRSWLAGGSTAWPAGNPSD